MSLPNGYLTGPNRLANGSNFCKRLIACKVYGLTGKTPPERVPLSLTSPTGPTLSKRVQSSPTQSNRIQPNPTTPPLGYPTEHWELLCC
jgi:hypothetical protein